MVNNHLVRLFGINEKRKKGWEFLINEILIAKNSDFASGLALFRLIITDLPFFAYKKRRYVRYHLNLFKKSFLKK